MNFMDPKPKAKEALEALAKVLEKHPAWRVGQAVSNVCGERQPFHVTNEQFIELCGRYT